MKNRTLFRWLADALIITVVASLLIHLMGIKESVDEHIFNLITLSFTLLILIIVIIMALILLLPVVDDEDKSEQQPKEYCVITFYSIVNVNRDQYMHAENSIIISEESKSSSTDTGKPVKIVDESLKRILIPNMSEQHIKTLNYNETILY